MLFNIYVNIIFIKMQGQYLCWETSCYSGTKSQGIDKAALCWGSATGAEPLLRPLHQLETNRSMFLAGTGLPGLRRKIFLFCWNGNGPFPWLLFAFHLYSILLESHLCWEMLGLARGKEGQALPTAAGARRSGVFPAGWLWWSSTSGLWPSVLHLSLPSWPTLAFQYGQHTSCAVGLQWRTMYENRDARGMNRRRTGF